MIASDASTLILLAKTELLDLFLNSTGMKVFITETVRKESTAGKGFDAKLIANRIEKNRILVEKAKDKAMTEKIREDFGLHPGETETIVVCIEKKLQLMLTDDYNAMKACAVLNIPFTSAIEILVKLAQENLLTKKEAQTRLEMLKYYGRYSDGIIEDAKNRMR